MNALTVADLSIVAGDEPRMMDLRLAEVLGFAHPRRIRALIRRHLEALKRFGEVRTTAVQTSAAGGRPSKAAWLNRKQALFVCTKSETERATDITIQIVEVFDEHTSATATVPAILVKAHRRAAPKRPLFTPSQKGRGVMMLDHLVYFDRRILPRAGDEVLVIDQQNQPCVAPVSDYTGAFVPGRIWVQIYDRSFRTWAHLPLIGVVVTAAGRPKRVATCDMGDRA